MENQFKKLKKRTGLSKEPISMEEFEKKYWSSDKELMENNNFIPVSEEEGRSEVEQLIIHNVNTLGNWNMERGQEESSGVKNIITMIRNYKKLKRKTRIILSIVIIFNIILAKKLWFKNRN